MKNPFKDLFSDKAEVVEKAATMGELGVAGAKISNGYVYEEFLPQLTLEKGRKVYREMRDNDATISAILFAIEMMLRAVDWTIEENEDTKGDQLSEDAKAFIEGVLFDDMSHTWDEFISQVLSMLPYGWQYTEVVYKRRIGPDEKDPSKRSVFDDGLIGIRKLGDRSQETLRNWDIDENGGLNGMFQEPPMGGHTRYIPIQKALLFKPHPTKGSPEGRSVLRGAYRSWHFLKNIQNIEAIAIERELNGLPVAYIPNAILNGTSNDAKAARAAYVKMVRDIKFNEQGGVVLPSDTYVDGEGNPTDVRQVELKLLASEGSRAIDTSGIILRYQQDIARTVLADFIMLGSSDAGSFALSTNKTEMFMGATEGWLDSIAQVINRYLIPKLWRLNNLDRAYMPYLAPGAVKPADLEKLGKYISDLSRAGAPLFPDDDLEGALRDAGDLPAKNMDESYEDSVFDIKTKPKDGDDKTKNTQKPNSNKKPDKKDPEVDEA